MSYPTNTSASDVWSLRDVYKSRAGGNWPVIFPTFDEATFLGTPTRTVTDIPSSFGPDNNGQQNYTYAVDIPTFISSDTGFLFELSGSTFGSSFQINENNLYVQSSGLEDTITSMTAFDNQAGTLYVSIDYTNSLYDIYWFNSSGFQLVVTGTISGDYVGSDDSAVGDSSSPGSFFGTGYGPYTGNISEFRTWEDTYFDFSTV